jgi:hypothetical protein
MEPWRVAIFLLALLVIERAASVISDVRVKAWDARATDRIALAMLLFGGGMFWCVLLPLAALWLLFRAVAIASPG